MVGVRPVLGLGFRDSLFFMACWGRDERECTKVQSNTLQEGRLGRKTLPRMQLTGNL